MGSLNRILTGRQVPPQPEPRGPSQKDAQALERYRYLLRTAPPEAVEEAHADAFAQLTPEQRAQALRELREQLPPGERGSGSGQDDPKNLARMATRAELREPGTLERVLGGRAMGGMPGGSLLSSIAGAFVGSAIAHQVLGGFDEASAIESADSSGDEAEDDQSDVSDDMGDFGD